VLSSSNAQQLLYQSDHSHPTAGDVDVQHVSPTLSGKIASKEKPNQHRKHIKSIDAMIFLALLASKSSL